jgi:hypothetical protein
MEWNNVTYAQTMFSHIGIMTNGKGTIDVDIFYGRRTILAWLQLDRIKMEDKTCISRLIVMWMTLAVVSMMQVCINGYLSAIINELKVS